MLVTNKPNAWNGDVRFLLTGGAEFLAIGFFPNTQKIAVRNDVFSRGTKDANTNFRFMSATYPEPDNEGNREYTFEFTTTGLEVQVEGSSQVNCKISIFLSCDFMFKRALRY